MMTVKDREAYANERRVRILSSKLHMRAADYQINRIVDQQRAQMPQVFADIDGSFGAERA
ncbi:hypothetical protein D3C71_2148370 [compost metagenome]